MPAEKKAPAKCSGNGSICDKNGYLKLSRMLRTVNGQYNGNPRIAMILRIKGLNYTEKFKVTTSHGIHGTITGSRWVKWGKDAEFAVTPEEGYEIAGATVNGKAIEVDPSAGSVTIMFGTLRKSPGERRISCKVYAELVYSVCFNGSVLKHIVFNRAFWCIWYPTMWCACCCTGIRKAWMECGWQSCISCRWRYVLLPDIL